jgi:pimeloyl-ACP methyl ester carboxylesterase
VAPPLPPVAGVEHRQVIVRGLRLHVAVAGPPGGPAVVLQHGWPQHWYQWRHLIGPLADAGYRVIVPDFRGFGWSEYPPDEDFRKETLGDDLVALLAELGHRRVHYVGHDWGCWVGWLLCLREPQLVERAVLLSVRSPIPPERIDPSALARLSSLWYQLVLGAPLPRPLKLTFFRRMGDVLKGETGNFEPYLRVLEQPAVIRATMLLYRQFVTREIGPLLSGRYRGRRVTVPVRFLVGDRDLLFEEGMEREPAEHADDYEGEVLRGIGHFIPEEAPDLLRERVLSFFGAAQGTPAAPR